jgi:multidrug efflux system outer membrane protein
MNRISSPARRALAPLLLALVLAGCATAPAGVQPQLPAAPASYKHAVGTSEAARPSDTWWSAFGDTTLNGLVTRATAGNTDIALAAARLTQARAQLGQARSQQSVQLGLDAGVERGRAGNGGSTQSSAALGVGARFELDLFGRLSGASQAAALDAQGREALLAAARWAVQAEVAQTYLALRAAEREQQLVADTAAAYRDTLALTERRFAAGDIAELDVARVRSELAATEAEAQAVSRQRSLLEHALATLLGVTPAEFTLEPSSNAANTLPTVPAGLPSALLRRRADLVAAELNLKAAEQRLGLAQKAWFPDLTLTAGGGVASNDLSELLTRGARAWGVGALLALPIFDGGRREAGVQRAQGVLEEAQAQHRAGVLNALREVDDQLLSLRTLRLQGEAQARAVDAASRATALSSTRWRNGLVSQLELLDAQRTELRNRRAALQVQTAQQLAVVGLARALGGGWQRSEGA